MRKSSYPPGATYLGGERCSFCVWAPRARKVEVRIVEPSERVIPMIRNEWGYHEALADEVQPGSLYHYILDGETERPDPASRFQPKDVHGPSQVVDASFDWKDDRWFGIPLKDYVIYELHVGAFTPEGTFDAIIPYLDYLKTEVGVTAVELMPVAQFPGSRNWGYDGVYPYAVQASYGGPESLKRLVNACHDKRLAVVLDVVYNHSGPEGNYLSDFGPYFTDSYRTPWGMAVNYDGPGSDEVKRFFIGNALYWLTEFHIDALRLDAVHAILDHSPTPFLEELSIAVRERAERLNRRKYLIAESPSNDARLVASREMGGLGMDSQWSDDFHHCVHTLLTGEKEGYYQDYGSLRLLAKNIREGYAYTGEHSPFRGRRHGSPTRRGQIPAERFVVCVQNHDHVGNRMLGERLSGLVSFEQLKLAAGVMLLSPFVPLLFMGEEYGEAAPFQYFISHSDSKLVEAVRKGRADESRSFGWKEDPPDPQDEATFKRAKLNHALREEGRHKALLEFYRELILLRKELPALSQLSKDSLEALAFEKSRTLYLRRWSDDGEAVMLFNFGDSAVSVTVDMPPGAWHKLLDSTERQWSGSGGPTPEWLSSDGEVTVNLAPYSVIMFTQEPDVS
ncbi:MAG: malto-oligosyltrehalose trehalohydrolase [Chloroflexi bacterium]|nr:malto-oligosyltrehalose trehalohydrolase [Chloroflexota bacterium]